MSWCHAQSWIQLITGKAEALGLYRLGWTRWFLVREGRDRWTGERDEREREGKREMERPERARDREGETWEGEREEERDLRAIQKGRERDWQGKREGEGQAKTVREERDRVVRVIEWRGGETYREIERYRERDGGEREWVCVTSLPLFGLKDISHLPESTRSLKHK